MSYNNNLRLGSRLINGNKPVQGLLANHLFYYPTPSNLTYAWSFGSLSGLFFALQIITGVVLAMHYTPHVEMAFSSVEHIMVDVNGGYLLRYFHANGASAIFILIYLHIARNLYFQSYLTRPVLWQSGLIIFLLMMATAFIGYVLPWGQMSFWGATVITSLVTAVPYVGQDIAHWVWGGFSINNATLTRFFSIHYLLPFLVTGVIGGHLVLLHTSGSSDPLTLQSSPDKLTFHPYFTYKDLYILTAVFASFVILVAFNPNLLGHSDNFIPANPLVTPAHIVPEWYFTPFYAILRACPNKLGGAIGMFAAIVMLFIIPQLYEVFSTTKHVVAPYSFFHKIAFWFFIAIFLILMFLGSRAAAAPYVVSSKIFTAAYFAYFLLAIPFLRFLGESMYESEEQEEASLEGRIQKKAFEWGFVEVISVIWFIAYIPYLLYLALWGYRYMVDTAFQLHWEQRQAAIVKMSDRKNVVGAFEINQNVDPYNGDDRFYLIYSDLWDREEMFEFHFRLVNSCRYLTWRSPLPNPMHLPHNPHRRPYTFWIRDVGMLPGTSEEVHYDIDPELDAMPNLVFRDRRIKHAASFDEIDEEKTAELEKERSEAVLAARFDYESDDETGFVVHEDEDDTGTEQQNNWYFDSEGRNTYIPWERWVSNQDGRIRMELELEINCGHYIIDEPRPSAPLVGQRTLDRAPISWTHPVTINKTLPSKVKEVVEALTINDKFPYVIHAEHDRLLKGHRSLYIPLFEDIMCELEADYYREKHNERIPLGRYHDSIRLRNEDEMAAKKTWEKSLEMWKFFQKEIDEAIDMKEEPPAFLINGREYWLLLSGAAWQLYMNAARENPCSIVAGMRFEGYVPMDFLAFTWETKGGI